MKINDDLKNEDMPLEQKEHFQRMHELVEHEIGMMDLDGLYEYATNQLWDYFGGKSDDEIKALYEEEIQDED